MVQSGYNIFARGVLSVAGDQNVTYLLEEGSNSVFPTGFPYRENKDITG